MVHRGSGAVGGGVGGEGGGGGGGATFEFVGLRCWKTVRPPSRAALKCDNEVIVLQHIA